ncbi:MAG: peptidylprolyl isomerase [Thaumarchaeota archaeon]|nr:peptidylprolyl isomerase [Nitrososphaerota archaeon]
MVNKPRARKKTSHSRAYLSAGVVAVLLIAGTGYLYVSGTYPFARGESTTTASCSPLTLPVTYTTLSSSNPVYAHFNTSLGSFEAELFPASAPKTVSNFVSLADSGFYDNLVWHRIEPKFVIQVGDPTTRCGLGDRSTWGQRGSNVTVPLEIDKSLHNYEGYLGMARSTDNNSGSSQFYVNLGNNTASLDGRYTVFGEVTGGISVVQALGSVPVQTYGNQNEPVNPVYIYSINITSVP